MEKSTLTAGHCFLQNRTHSQKCIINIMTELGFKHEHCFRFLKVIAMVVTIVVCIFGNYVDLFTKFNYKHLITSLFC